VATHFSHLLRHAWVTVGLFLFPGHHTGKVHFVTFLILGGIRFELWLGHILFWLRIFMVLRAFRTFECLYNTLK